LAGARNRVDLEEVATSAGDRAGVVWTLEAGEDLNANLVRFGPGRGVGEHINDEVDVLVLGVSGSGIVIVDGEEHALESGRLVFVPRGSRRCIRSASEGFAYLTVHRRRGPPGIGTRGDRASSEGQGRKEDA
jgi:quercetin dioxygenase-like cupin family protein